MNTAQYYALSLKRKQLCDKIKEGGNQIIIAIALFRLGFIERKLKRIDRQIAVLQSNRPYGFEGLSDSITKL